MSIYIDTYCILYDLYIEDKKSINEISKITGMSSSTIHRKLIEYAIEIRNKAEAQTGKRATKATKAKLSGKNHWAFKGRVKDKQGYILIYTANHPYKNCNNRVYEHRLVMEQYLGRYLIRKEVVHHINGIRDDNRIDNLRLFATATEHGRLCRLSAKYK